MKYYICLPPTNNNVSVVRSMHRYAYRLRTLGYTMRTTSKELAKAVPGKKHQLILVPEKIDSETISVFVDTEFILYHRFPSTRKAPLDILIDNLLTLEIPNYNLADTNRRTVWKRLLHRMEDI